MSWDALKIAAGAKCRTPTAKLVFIMLANYADENYSSYPSNAKLADLCSCDERTIKRAIKTLVDDGLVRVTPRYTADGKQTSNSFTIVRYGGDIFEGVGVTEMTPNTIRDTPTTNTLIRGDRNAPPKSGYTDQFNDWWKLYPRSDGSKKKAFEAYQKAIDEIEPQELQNKTAHFAHQNRNAEQRYIPHATTWLNQKRWETVDTAMTHPTTNRNQLAG